MLRHIRNRFALLALSALILGALPSAALADPLTRDDIIKLAQAKVGDDVILKQIEASGTVFDLSPDDLVALKNAGVSEKVIAAMVQTKVDAEAKKKASSPEPADAPKAPAGKTGTVSLENRFARDLYVRVLPDERSVFVSAAEVEGARVVHPGESWKQALPRGMWSLTWSGKGALYSFLLDEGRTVPFDVQPFQTEALEAIQIRRMAGDKTLFSGLVEAQARKKNPEPAPEIRQTYPPPTRYYGGATTPSVSGVYIVQQSYPYYGPYAVGPGYYGGGLVGSDGGVVYSADSAGIWPYGGYYGYYGPYNGYWGPYTYGSYYYSGSYFGLDYHNGGWGIHWGPFSYHRN